MPSNTWNGSWRGVAPDGDQHSRSRTIVRHTGGIVRGKFPSRKNGRMVHHEGLLELDAIYLFEASPRIVRYREQPPTICYPDGHRLRRYTPDFELVLQTGELIWVEVKPTRSLQSEEVRHKLDCVAAHMRRSAMPFLILTDIAIRQEPRLSNIRRLYHHAARVPPTLAAVKVAVERYCDCFPMSLTKATALFSECGLDPFSVLLAGQAQCSLEHPISPETQLQITEASHGWFWIAQEFGF